MPLTTQRYPGRYQLPAAQMWSVTKGDDWCTMSLNSRSYCQTTLLIHFTVPRGVGSGGIWKEIHIKQVYTWATPQYCLKKNNRATDRTLCSTCLQRLYIYKHMRSWHITDRSSTCCRQVTVISWALCTFYIFILCWTFPLSVQCLI